MTTIAQAIAFQIPRIEAGGPGSGRRKENEQMLQKLGFVNHGDHFVKMKNGRGNGWAQINPDNSWIVSHQGHYKEGSNQNDLHSHLTSLVKKTFK